ncbi:HWE histidine kinase domain-containing protein [Pararhizobium sp.]|uniref:HWE histidine kinase domain-containing protein n=1 Tax=Pararhizobium sp. TaxID=1977563 RepID=UPI00271A40D1|nr:HWE histidine kinase domain-containing protein [Pararhizobium sp.]MDO9418752.1 HWE histidine kinase domain-containing protein [Pararhizobium sp.]
MNDLVTKVDLTNCDREPIHQLGSVQPFGFLLAVSSDWLISRASANAAEFTGIEPLALIGRHLGDVTGAEALHTIRNHLTLVRGPDALERIFGIRFGSDPEPFDVALHISDGTIVLEAERSQTDRDNVGINSIRGIMGRLDQAQTMEAFFREGARQARALTGFDRVMVYRFDEEGAGEVVAEAAKAGIGSFMGLHYPASDIPVQARALYLRNLFRIIADIDAEPVGIVPGVDEYGRPLDLSMSILRSVSPIHIEYLRNMGVGASLSISIVVEGKLWGLFACHHYSARLPSFERRSTAELFGQMFASRLESRQRRLALDYETRTRRIADQLLTSVADNSTLLTDPAWLVDALADVIPADGIGVWVNGQLSLVGLTPDEDGFATLVKGLNRNAAGKIFATDHLSGFLASDVTDSATAGFLAIPISRSPRDYVVLFRQEIIRTVRWAGDPHKPVEYGPNGPRLTPRKSFEAWSELVRGRSLPFTAAELRVAETIRVTLIEVVLRLTDDASAVRLQAHERQELLIAELNHRVRNILSLISGLVRRTRASSTTVDDYIAHIEGRVQSLARAHDQITRDNWTPAPLRTLLDTEAAAYLGKAAARVVLSGHDVLLSPPAFSTTALVFHELMTNSAKYGSLSESGTVEVRWESEPGQPLVIHWSETGGPPVKEPQRQGFGTTIIKRSIPYDLKGEAEVLFEPSGLKARFVIPAQHVTFPEPGIGSLAGPKVARQRPDSLIEEPLKGKRVLLVEDNLIIAMDGEDIVHRLGAASVVTASTVADALHAIGTGAFDFGILDVNLGEEMSFAVADRLVRDGTPFIFATGYGDTLSRSEVHAKAPILQKPYTIESMSSLLADVVTKM